MIATFAGSLGLFLFMFALAIAQFGIAIGVIVVASILAAFIAVVATLHHYAMKATRKLIGVFG